MKKKLRYEIFGKPNRKYNRSDKNIKETISKLKNIL